MITATRFSLNGERFYRPADRPDAAYPSVTTILGKTASEHSKKALLSWAAKNPGAREAAAERGSAIHAACEAHIRGQRINIPEEYRPFWRGLEEQLDKYDSFLWSERPLLPQWKSVIGDDGIARIWSHKHGYAGVPDLIGVRNGVVIMGDFKTSTGPYSRWFPKDDNRKLFTGWSKYKKCAEQLAAYALAAEETLGVHVDCAQILVSTPEISQSFFIHGDELLKHRTSWLQKVRRYYELKAEEQEQQAELEAMAGPCRTLALAAA